MHCSIPFNRGNLNIHGFWCLWRRGILASSPEGATEFSGLYTWSFDYVGLAPLTPHVVQSSPVHSSTWPSCNYNT